jgi:pimeloyl-ACP methyl ester carboxylesterase
VWNQAQLCVEGWDEAVHEIDKLSCETVLSPQNSAALLKAVAGMPVLVIAGAEDVLVPLKSSQAMASKLVNSVSVSLFLLEYWIGHFGILLSLFILEIINEG